MSEAPSMPMYWDAYLADTTHLTTEEHGAYFLLLGAMWRRNGCVPDDDKDTARIVGVSIGKWRRIKQRLSLPPISLKFENGTISQKKLQKTWKKTQEKIQVNRENGAKGGRPKSINNNDLDKADGFNSVKPIKTIPEPEPELYKNPDASHHTPKGVESTALATAKNVSEKKRPRLFGFDEFWNVYAHKKARPKCEEIWKRKNLADISEQVINGARQYAQNRSGESKFWKHPQGWLNDGRWTDEVSEPGSKQQQTYQNIADVAEMIDRGELKFE